MRRRDFITLLGGAAVGWPLATRAQQPAKAPIIGYLSGATPAAESQRGAAFVQRLRELGWIEGHTIAILSGAVAECESIEVRSPEVFEQIN